MIKFEEYRDRAYAFCKRLNFESAEMSNSKHDFAIHVHPQIFMVRLRDSEIIYTWHDPHGNGYFKDVTESEWLSSIESHFGVPFPSLLEAQGWIELKDGSVPPKEPVLGKLENKTGYVTGVVSMGLFNGSETYAMEPPHRWVIKREIITHYKPIEFGGAE